MFLGKVIVKVEPDFGFETRLIFPFSNLTNLSTIANPKPVLLGE